MRWCREEQKSVSHGQGLVDELSGLNAWCKVTELLLGCCLLSRTGAVSLAEAISSFLSASLVELDLERIDIQESGGRALAETLHLNTTHTHTPVCELVCKCIDVEKRWCPAPPPSHHLSSLPITISLLHPLRDKLPLGGLPWYYRGWTCCRKLSGHVRWRHRLREREREREKERKRED
jgi:hypothetical protein